MSIERVSRYYTGPLAQTKDKYTDSFNISVFRDFPKNQEVTYVLYTWKDGDTLTALADSVYMSPKFWWKIMEINPEIEDPMRIYPGTILKVPYGLQ
jgi:nucleoid-associated protein YgaU